MITIRNALNTTILSAIFTLGPVLGMRLEAADGAASTIVLSGSLPASLAFDLASMTIKSTDVGDGGGTTIDPPIVPVVVPLTPEEIAALTLIQTDINYSNENRTFSSF